VEANPQQAIEFDAMGSSCRIVSAADPTLTDVAVERVAQLESIWSRFLPTSDISKLNSSCGTPIEVSPETVELLRASVIAWRETDGAFDPTLLPSLAKLGYARSRTNPAHETQLSDCVTPGGDPSLIRVDGSSVRFPPNLTIDPGGIGKGLTADIVAQELHSSSAEGALIEIGGDISTSGDSPHGRWVVNIWDPYRTHTTHQVALRSGGVATSSICLRTWPSDSGPRFHHLIDPVTHTPTRNGIVACTVIAGTAAWAEVFTKVVFAAHDIAMATAALNNFSLAALLTDEDGCEYTCGNWKEFEI
jgi:thiamine biosynthesis lipoprotein